MPPRFPQGAVAYAKDGRRYVVDEVADGIVYCTSSGGGETEFPEAQLLNEAEWAARSDIRRTKLYDRLKQAKLYAPRKDAIDRAGAEQFLIKADRLLPGILDFAAFTVATRILTENGDQDLLPELSIVKCRAVFDAASPEIRASLLAGLLNTQPDLLIGAVRLGDNLLRAMLEKGLGAHAADFEAFGARRRH